jgi:penicillin amidase
MGRATLIVLALLAVAVAVVAGVLRASLPKLDGSALSAGLQASVTIERDALGVPTIVASNRLDALHALGFVHAQDRFFQMDQSRRFAAGEMAALLGPPLLEFDKEQRPRRMRHTASQALAALPPGQREMALAYQAGVNAGLASLKSRPPEYWGLRVEPRPWRPEDTLLAIMAMAWDLTSPPGDRLDTLLEKDLGPEAFEFFFPNGTEWDAALDGTETPTAPIPGPDLIDFRTGWNLGTNPVSGGWKEWVRSRTGTSEKFPLENRGEDPRSESIPGSNGWAVDGSVSSTGSAYVASDMHLGYSVPGAHYRVRMRWREGTSERDVIGLTLPGVPAITTGSNGDVAWAPTAAALDIVDQIVVETDPANPRRYRVPGGWADFEYPNELIEVRGSEPVELEIRSTRWGPVLEKNEQSGFVDFDGQPIAEAWVFLSPDAVSLRFLDLLIATSTEDALQIAKESGTPIINLLIGDRAGNIGWTIAGRLPKRMGKAGNRITSWADGSNGWDGWLAPSAYPEMRSPAVSRVFSGNQRKLGSEAYRLLNQSESPFGVRAKQIRDALARTTNATASSMMAIQLDDRVLLLEAWRQLALNTLRLPNAAAALTNSHSKVLGYLSEWDGRVTPDSVAFRLLRGIRVTTMEYLFEPLTVRATELAGKPAARFWGSGERPVWALLKARPPHLLNPRFSSYDQLLIAATAAVVAELETKHGGDIGKATWGQRTSRPVPHLFSRAIPPLSRWLDLSVEGCGGGPWVPRLHTGDFGAGERLVVSPGHEEEGLFHMLGGQSGHFLSPFYRAGHEAWVRGEPMPLLPGPKRHTLTLAPDSTRPRSASSTP